MKYWITVNGRPHEVDLIERLGRIEVAVDGTALDVVYEEVDQLGQVALFVGGEAHAMSIEGDEAAVSATLDGYLYSVEIEDERERAAHAAERAAAGGGGVVKSVMPGVVIQVLVAEGEEVSAGQPLLILEAMKMQNEIGAVCDGVVTALHVAEGEPVDSGAALATIEPHEESGAD